METRPESGRLTFLGNPSPWLSQFLGKLGESGLFKIDRVPTSAQFLAVPVPRNRVSVVLLENTPHGKEEISAIRESGRKGIIIWVGKTFSKEDLQFAFEKRVHTFLENPLATDTWVAARLKDAVTIAATSERDEDLFHSIKTALVELSEETNPAIHELKAALAKLERGSIRNEFLGSSNVAGSGTRLPFFKGQAMADALLMIEDLERTGTLWIRGKSQSQSGKVDFIQGRPTFATCGEARGLKAIYRMFLWEEPSFQFTRLEATEAKVEEKFALSLREISQEGEALLARYSQIKSELPPPTLKLRLDPAALQNTTRLDRAQFSTLSSVVELERISQILDYNPLPDVVLLESLIALKKSGLIRVAS